jgi:uncharacterized protein
MTRRCVGVILTLLAMASTAFAQDRPGVLPERTVSTAGQASVRLAPDRAWVRVGIEARAMKPQEAQKRAALIMQAVQQKLGEIGIPKEAVRTVAFNLTADWDYSNNRRVLRGYVVSNHIEVKVDALDKLADVLDQSIAAGANAVHGIRWDLQDRDKVERDALRRAVEDARIRAEVAVAAAGGRLGPVARISEQRFESPRPRMDTMMLQRAEASDASAPETPISPGEIEVRASVNVAFTIV